MVQTDYSHLYRHAASDLAAVWGVAFHQRLETPHLSAATVMIRERWVSAFTRPNIPGNPRLEPRGRLVSPSDGVQAL